MLGHCLWHWPNTRPPFGQCLVSAGEFTKFNENHLRIDWLDTEQLTFFLDYPPQRKEYRYIIHKSHLFLLLTFTDRNEAIIVELKEVFVLDGTFITFSGGSHH